MSIKTNGYIVKAGKSYLWNYDEGVWEFMSNPLSADRFEDHDLAVEIAEETGGKVVAIVQCEV